MDTYQTQGKGSAEPISNAGYKLVAPKLLLRVEDHGREGRIVRSDGDSLSLDALQAACEASGARLMREFNLDLEGATGNAAVKRSDGELELAADAPLQLVTPAQEALQSAILHQDEYGELRWILPRQSSAEGEKTFDLPPLPAGPAHRGPVTQKIRRIVKVIAWVAGDVIGHLALNLVTNWEQKHRPYALLGYNNRQFTSSPNWDRIKNGGKALLFLHGTFSTAQAAFSGLLADEAHIKSLEQAYEGRIFAFNHPSLHASPKGNIQQLSTLLPPELQRLEVDMITHSRGGLVGRELIAQSQQASLPGLKVNKAIFVAGPHQGTILTDEQHWITLLDTYTNLLLKLPDNAVTVILEGIISLVKILGGSTVRGLPGLQAMRPGGEYLQSLAQADLAEAQIHTIGARYLPMGDNVLGMLKGLALKIILKKLFGEDSDMVVPTLGSLSVKPDDPALVPPKRQLLLNSDSAINHMNFFQSAVVNRQLVNWLTI